MKQLVARVFSIVLILCFEGCAQPVSESSTEIIENTTSVVIPLETTASAIPTDGNSANDDFYAGKPAELMVTYKDYQYRYTGRDLHWEETVVSLFQALVQTHPMLKDGYSHTKMKNGEFVWLNQNEYYDPSSRTALNALTEDLLNRIPQMEEYEITAQMRRMVALLEDAHSMVDLIPALKLPISVELMEKNGELGLFAVRVPMDQQELLYCKLVAINGFAIQDVIELLMPYVGEENEYGEYAEAVRLLNNFDVLCAIGVAKAEEQAVLLAMQDHADQMFTVSMDAFASDLVNVITVRADFYSNEIGAYARLDENYWYVLWPEENALYFRIAACVERDDLSVSACCGEILDALKAAQMPMRLIIDLRGNGGGYYPLDGTLDFALAIDKMELDGVYILTDSRCYSATTYLAAMFRQYISDAVFIGTPLGQPFGFFAGSKSITLSDGETSVFVSTAYANHLPELSGTTFMPDILLYPDWEDYTNRVDTLIKAALSNGRAALSRSEEAGWRNLYWTFCVIVL